MLSGVTADVNKELVFTITGNFKNFLKTPSKYRFPVLVLKGRCLASSVAKNVTYCIGNRSKTESKGKHTEKGKHNSQYKSTACNIQSEEGHQHTQQKGKGHNDRERKPG